MDDINELKRRVRRGYYWLIAHADESDVRFDKNLKLYEKLVDRLRELNITEKECIDFEADQLTVDTMTEEETRGRIIDGGKLHG